jgi:predicted MPP superfamily phosphohydrolase
LGAPVVPVRNPSYVSGLVTSTRRRVFISRGVGWGGIPLRLNCPPEVALLVLTRADRSS